MSQVVEQGKGFNRKSLAPQVLVSQLMQRFSLTSVNTHMKRLSVKSIGIRATALTITCLIGGMATYVLNRVYVRFDKVAMGSIAMEAGGWGSLSSYRASDGVNLTFTRLDFRSSDDATKAFEEVLRASNKIISREFVRDREGKSVVGERVFVLFPFDDGREWPMMVCLHGTRLYEISSTSLRHILIFEKRYRRF